VKSSASSHTCAKLRVLYSIFYVLSSSHALPRTTSIALSRVFTTVPDIHPVLPESCPSSSSLCLYTQHQLLFCSLGTYHCAYRCPFLKDDILHNHCCRRPSSLLSLLLCICHRPSLCMMLSNHCALALKCR
jgi:hypothetical protein